ncbi:E3 ubiquitin-protein ligase RNF19B [Colletotrichum higginsianum]|uniref:RBR-type E3 ubiquitin transferase n=1 Tax=Colletotrichum higginsianum TaxID=80884 RepID=A0A4T0VX09_9PEZI|nr:E3 ubiquitin-protein ligase RNF19B [Colletotrichum higginsianum]
MFAPRNNGPPPSYHSSANSSLVGGFGGDDGFDSDPPQYDWVMAADVGSPREEQRPSTRSRIAQREQPLASSSHEAPRRAHYYRATSAEIMADFDFPVPTPKQTPAVTETAGPSTSPARPQRGYLLPTPASILAGFDVAPFSPQTTGGSTSTAATTPPMPSPSTRPAYNSRLDSWSANNPYVALLEQKEQAMTVAFLRSQDAGSGSRSADLAADDFSFGQRYHKAADTTDVVVTRQRLPANDLGGSRECPICAETRDPASFPVLSVTPTCTHPPEACLDCLQTSIRSDLNSKLWTEIRCPECREPLEYVDIQKYADEETFARYEALALRAAMAEADTFIWCTANCGSGQLHDMGGDRPLVTCLHCGQRSCFTHGIAWHENLSCDEYDALLRDPENFRSRIEMEHDDEHDLAPARRALEDADRAVAQGLMAEQRAEAREREAQERDEKERARKAVALARKVAARRKAEEEQSRATVSRTTRPCPGTDDADDDTTTTHSSHMTCSKCKHEFCYDCGADHKRVLKFDNSVHSEGCRFHPNNMFD